MLIKTLQKLFTKKPIQKVVLMPGDGIGPEITEGVKTIFTALKIPIEWEQHKIHSKSVTKDGDLISAETMSAIEKYGYGLKGPFMTPIGKGHRSLNVTLRKKLKLYANVRPCISIPGIKGLLYNNVDLVTIRENTEGEYSGLEHEVIPGVVENLKIITKKASDDINKFAFEYAKKHNRKNLICVHKAGVMKLGDGCFLDSFTEHSKNYPSITTETQQVDTICTKIVKNPNEIDMMVMPNLYGDIISDLCAGLIGGLGLTPSGNIGEKCSVFEAVHGTAPDIAGKGLANPTALILSSTMMLEQMGMFEQAEIIKASVRKVIKEGKWVTGDLGGNARTGEYVQAIVDNLGN